MRWLRPSIVTCMALVTRTPSQIVTPPLRAPLASASVRSAGLAFPSPGSQTAPCRSRVCMIG